jgi:hypothetical protein
MKHENGILELETDGYSFHLYGEDSSEIMWNNNMDMDMVLRNLELSAWNNYTLTIRDITFRNGVPFICHTMFFDYLDDGKMVESAICKLAELSITHRMMYMTDVGQIYVTKSENHQTNIDSELLDTISKYYLKGNER